MNTQQMIPVTTRFSLEDKRVLELYAKKMQISISDIIRERVMPLIQENKKDKIDLLLEEIDALNIPDKVWEEHEKDLEEARKNFKLGRSRIVGE